MTATFDVNISHLNHSEAERLRALLLQERQALTRQLAEYAEVLAELGEDGTDAQGVERELVGLHAARGRDVVEAIDQALSRLADGSYGVCECCAKPIPFERLEAIPRAPFCLACPPPSIFGR